MELAGSNDNSVWHNPSAANDVTCWLDDHTYSQVPTEADSLFVAKSNNIILCNEQAVFGEEIVTAIAEDVSGKRCGRKRKCDPSTWKKEVKKRNRLEGKPYVNSRHKLMPCKSPKLQDCTCCTFKCAANFPEWVRSNLCEQFYALGTWERQMDFICSTVTKQIVKQSQAKFNPKHQSFSYSFMRDGERQRVCKSFYCKTLSITSKCVIRAMVDKNAAGVFGGTDKCKGKVPVNKISKERVNGVKRHIDEFPRIEPHYCRADSNLQYISPELNITKMFNLYCNDFCVCNGVSDPVTFSKYRDVFLSDYKLRCFAPKKDQCSNCNAFYNGSSEYKESIQATWEEHKTREKEALDCKASDKRRSLEDPSFHPVTFDLQAVLYTPHAAESQIYYKRKLYCL